MCNQSFLSVPLSQKFYFPSSWAPQARSEAWEVYPWELYPLDDPPRPSRPKAGLGLVMMMMMMMMARCIVHIKAEQNIFSTYFGHNAMMMMMVVHAKSWGGDDWFLAFLMLMLMHLWCDVEGSVNWKGYLERLLKSRDEFGWVGLWSNKLSSNILVCRGITWNTSIDFFPIVPTRIIFVDHMFANVMNTLL